MSFQIQGDGFPHRAKREREHIVKEYIETYNDPTKIEEFLRNIKEPFKTNIQEVRREA